MLPVTARKFACAENWLSYPPLRHFSSPIVLLLLRANKPIRMDFLCIFLEDFRGPRKAVFLLKIVRSKSAGKSWRVAGQMLNFQGLVFVPNTEKLFFGVFKWKKNCKSIFRWPQKGKSRSKKFSNLSGEDVLLPTIAVKTWRSEHFQVSFDDRSHI